MPRSALLYPNWEILQFFQQFGLPVRPHRVQKRAAAKMNFATAPKGLIFNPFCTMEMAHNWLLSMHETLTPVRLRVDVGIDPYGQILRLTALPCRGSFWARCYR